MVSSQGCGKNPNKGLIYDKKKKSNHNLKPLPDRGKYTNNSNKADKADKKNQLWWNRQLSKNNDKSQTKRNKEHVYKRTWNTIKKNQGQLKIMRQ